MILTSGRIIPNWIIHVAFEMFNEDTTMADIIEDMEDILQDELNMTDHSKLSAKDALEIFGKFNKIWSDYEDMLYEFFEKHGLGDDEYDGYDDDNDNDDNDNDDNDDDYVEPDDPEDNVPSEEPKTYRDLTRAEVK